MVKYDLKLCSSKNSDGNKTMQPDDIIIVRLCSSKNSDGNKTYVFTTTTVVGYVLAKIQMVTKQR